VFLHQRLLERRELRARHARCGQDLLAAHGIVLLRHAAAAATLTGHRLGQLGQLALAKQDHILRDLAQAAREQAEPGAQLHDAIALRVPGQLRSREAQLSSEPGDHLGRTRAERRQGTGSTAQLYHRKARQQLAQPLLLAQER
jgi:hypothetical protein